MAVKKKASTTKKKSNTGRKARASDSKALMSMTEYEKQMASDATNDSARIASSSTGSYISTRNGTFTYQDSDLGDSMDVVIVGFASENSYFDSPWDPDDPNSPACAAVGMDDNDYLEASDDSPSKQSDTCEECEYNQWGSADVGKGKKCKNGKRLALVAADSIASDEPEVAMLRIAPTSLGHFNKFVKGLEKTLKRPTYGVIANIHFDPDDDKVLRFKAVEPVSSVEELQAVQNIRALAEDVLLADPDFSNYHTPVKNVHKTSRSTTKKKRASTKKTSKFSK